MNPQFNRNLFFVSIAHAVVIGALLVTSLITGCTRPKAQVLVPIDFVVEVPSGAEPEQGRESIAPPPEEDDAIAPPKPKSKPKPEVKPKPETPPKPKPKAKPIETSKVKAPTPISSKPRTSKLTEEQIRKFLEMGARPGDYTSIPSEDQWGFERIRRTLYDAWLQPGLGEVGNATAEVELTLAADGSVFKARMLRRSGNPVFDDSVEKAIGLVQRIDNLPPPFIERHKRVSIAFKLDSDAL